MEKWQKFQAKRMLDMATRADTKSVHGKSVCKHVLLVTSSGCCAPSGSLVWGYNAHMKAVKGKPKDDKMNNKKHKAQFSVVKITMMKKSKGKCFKSGHKGH
ncbi:hypothetical protein FNV43_RR09570 [Rhamnella rubrinervis]|uniref:Uncharacterized protein n=1 Tax=Rhamnella rubrinervis TaxID=2594499 RepID=A0A8K0HAN9_9ROSA|nr:hypothetical protein FNV43_RR09570 [Rhamnella rubrinervis]